MGIKPTYVSFSAYGMRQRCLLCVLICSTREAQACIKVESLSRQRLESEVTKFEVAIRTLSHFVFEEQKEEKEMRADFNQETGRVAGNGKSERPLHMSHALNAGPQRRAWMAQAGRLQRSRMAKKEAGTGTRRLLMAFHNKRHMDALLKIVRSQPDASHLRTGSNQFMRVAKVCVGSSFDTTTIIGLAVYQPSGNNLESCRISATCS